MKKTSIATLLLVALAGCATTPTGADRATAAIGDRLLAYQEKPQGPSGRIVVTRDSGFLGGQCFYAVSINGKLAARLAVGESATFYVEPGEILLRSSRDPMGRGLCSVMSEERTQRETIIRQDETKHFRLSIDANGKTDIQRADK
ncbi:MAG: hypothetical protein ABL916_23945 [Burkholderiaceae bacterium]